MNKITLILLAVMVLASACTPQPSPARVSAPTATPTPLGQLTFKVSEATYTPVPTASSASDNSECENPFYPVSDEATWTYDISTGGSATHVMSADDFGAFTINIQSDTSTYTIDGKCTVDGIVLMDAPGALTTYSGEEGSSVVSTVDTKGVTLPKDIKINDQWSQTVNVTTGDLQSLIQTDFTALGFENITVPAGDFYALKVEQSGYVEIYGQKVKMHGYQWFAEGVGTVKSAWDGSPTLELASYDIPD